MPMHWMKNANDSKRAFPSNRASFQRYLAIAKQESNSRLTTEACHLRVMAGGAFSTAWAIIVVGALSEVERPAEEAVEPVQTKPRERDRRLDVEFFKAGISLRKWVPSLEVFFLGAPHSLLTWFECVNVAISLSAQSSV
jgi:hypothetical protein